MGTTLPPRSPGDEHDAIGHDAFPSPIDARPDRRRAWGLAIGVVGYVHGMIIVGIICLLLGLILGVPILWTIGIILVVIGLILLLLGTAGREFGGRRYWY